jgi:hypothetical protein
MLYENAYSNLRDSVHQVFNLLNTVGFAKWKKDVIG